MTTSIVRHYLVIICEILGERNPPLTAIEKAVGHH